MQKQRLSRRALTLAVGGIATGSLFLVFMFTGSDETPITIEDIPLPFDVSNSSDPAGQLVNLGRKGQVQVRQFTFDNDETQETIQGSTRVNSVDFVLTPDSPTISAGATLCQAVTSGKEFFGYKYTARAATAERTARDEAATGVPKTFTELFPGQFFATAEQRADGNFISAYEAQKNMTFADACSITLDKNARYIIVVNDTNTIFTARGITVASCGNGVKEGQEQCDDGNQLNTDACTNTCTSAACGDTFVQETEQCDDGNIADGDGCSALCNLETDCGNGEIEGLEQCDDQNVANGDGCTQCRIDSGYICNNNFPPSVCEATCGNRSTEPNGADGIAGNADDEECDDANTHSGDGCYQCKLEPGFTCDTNFAPTLCDPICGDGLKTVMEQCDDGNQSNTDTCTNQCQNPRCGDSFIQGTEQCDDANLSNTDSCTNACKNAVCGDTFKQGTEQCDDGNTASGDGCSATCTVICGDSVCVDVEDFSDVQCPSGQGVCANPLYCPADCAVCGDFIKEGAEECDDGNQTNTDSCTNVCQNARCGDGFRQGSETCDDGNQTQTDACKNDCSAASCGDGFHQAAGADGQSGTADDEQCDDGNRVDDDACDNQCRVLSPF